MLRNYLLTAWNVFLRRKLFTAINLLCIVLTLVVLLVVTALLQEAFYPSGVEGKSDRFLQVLRIEATNADRSSIRTTQLGYKVIEKYLKPMQGVELVAAVTSAKSVSIYQEGNVAQVLLRHADAEYWRVLDFKVLAGRVPSADDVAQGRMVAVLNQSTARRLFAGAAPLGRKLDVAGQSFTIIGVVEDALHMNALADVWVPLTTNPSSEYRQQMSGDFIALVLARSAADLPAIRADVQRIAGTVQFDDPRQYSIAHFWADSKIDMFARLITGSRELDAGAAVVLAGIGGAMLLFMLLPALNLVNLNVGRIMERSTEIGVRKAFGASSAQLAAQLVLENVLLCLAGGLIALVCANVFLWWLEGSKLIPYFKVSLNLAVFAWGLVITTIFGVLSGVIPAWKMSRLDPVHALKGNV